MKAVAPVTVVAALSIFASTAFFVPVVAPTATGDSETMILPFHRYNTAGEIPAPWFRKHTVLYGRVVKVVDGDTFRIRHYPLYPLVRSSSYQGRLSDHTISVRIYGVDAPELGKFGKPAMPEAETAKQYTANLVDGKIVRVKLLRRDQYNRAVGKVTVRHTIPIFKTDVSIGLAKKGYATLYTGGGAEYDGKKDRFEKEIATARRRRRGIWKNGEALSPAEFKKQLKAGNKK
uniref:TNase-like domain-containing protein n=1 Tax=Attheya septentrionalis TaxID=420275 RepID=A0A7S2UCP4_9STRA|mmetsp:Transcript_17808/g.32239  ORF Transcript_17808/g.32239 Transcript_17808/m.32239 type:complete len:232 (+) Transcript_17808:77-772(+)